MKEIKEITRKFINYLEAKGYAEKGVSEESSLFTKQYTVDFNTYLQDIIIETEGAIRTVYCRPRVPDLPQGMIFVETNNTLDEAGWGIRSNADILIQEVGDSLFQINFKALQNLVKQRNPNEDFPTWIPVDGPRGKYVLGWVFELAPLIEEGIARKLA